MAKFKVGEQARIIFFQSTKHPYVGKECTILAVDYNDPILQLGKRMGTIANKPFYLANMDGKEIYMLEEHMEKIQPYDGYEKTSWENSLWQPKGVAIK